MQVECHTHLSPTLADEWQAFLQAAAHAHPRQDLKFAEVERGLGRDVIFAIGRQNGAVSAVGLFSLVRHAFLSGAHAEGFCLSGPVADDQAVLVDFLQALAGHSALARVGRLRVTPYWLDAEARALQAQLQAAGWRITDPEPMRSTGWVDLSRSAEEIVASFSKSARREIRRAERQEINVRPITDLGEAMVFLDSLNRLRHQRHLTALNTACFRENFLSIHASGDLGVLIGAFHAGDFVAGLLLYRSHRVAHGRHFTTEPDRLRALSNLRIAPLLWREGMLWARDRGCQTLDVEGYRADLGKGETLYNVYKYKSEFSPTPVTRLAEHGRVLARMVHLTGNGKAIAKTLAKRLLRRG